MANMDGVEFSPSAVEPDIGFERITYLESRIAHLEARLDSPKMSNGRRRKANFQLAEFQAEHSKLKAVHDEGAKVLREKAQALLRLPREMRDAILAQIYVQKDAIGVAVSRIGDGWHFDMPKDTALYMSKLHVGEDLAREAAEIFYKQNTFMFVRIVSQSRTNYPHFNNGFTQWTQPQIDAWFATDHYGCGLVPRNIVRRLRLQLDRLAQCLDQTLEHSWRPQAPVDQTVCNHVKFENIVKKHDGTDSWHDHRGRLRSLLRYNTLQHIEIVFQGTYWNSFDAALRMLNPVFREFREAGVNTRLLHWANNEYVELIDISHVFDKPVDGDFAEYYEFTPREDVFTDKLERDLFDTFLVMNAGNHASDGPHHKMMPSYHPLEDQFSAIRVWLFEHYEMYKFLARDGESYAAIEEMVRDVQNMSPKEKEMKRRFFSTVLDHYS